MPKNFSFDWYRKRGGSNAEKVPLSLDQKRGAGQGQSTENLHRDWNYERGHFTRRIRRKLQEADVIVARVARIGEVKF